MKATYKNIEELPIMLNANDIVNVLGISRAFAYNIMHDKSLPVIVLGKRRVVNRDKFFTWLEKCEHTEEAYRG
jgi:predicted DNA-binding transcriptional regulator AlpA